MTEESLASLQDRVKRLKKRLAERTFNFSDELEILKLEEKVLRLLAEGR